MTLKEYSEILKIISDENRLKIITIINSEKEVCVCDLIKYFDFTQPTFSYHMKLLKDANLVECRKDGVACIYRLNNDIFKKLSVFLENPLD